MELAHAAAPNTSPILWGSVGTVKAGPHIVVSFFTTSQKPDISSVDRTGASKRRSPVANNQLRWLLHQEGRAFRFPPWPDSTRPQLIHCTCCLRGGRDAVFMELTGIRSVPAGAFLSGVFQQSKAVN